MGRPRAGRRRWALVPMLVVCWLAAPPAAGAVAGAADDPEVHAYAGVGLSPGDGDPGREYLYLTVRNATACALPAGAIGPEAKATRGVRVESGGRRLYPSVVTAAPEDQTGTEVWYSGADDLIIETPARGPAGSAFPLRLDCRDRAGTWVKVLDRSIPSPGHAGVLPVLHDLVAANGAITVADVSAQYSQPPKVTAATLTAEVEGRPAQVRAGRSAGLMSVRLPPGLTRGVHLLTLRSGSQVTTVPIINGFAVTVAPPPARPAPRREPRSAVLRAVPTLSQLSPTPATVGLTVGAAGTLLALIAFPAQPFNRTLDEHEEQIRRGLRRLAGRRGGAGAAPAAPARVRIPPLLAFAGFCVLAAGLGVLVDTHVTTLGADAAVLFTGFLVAVPLTTLTYAGVVELYARLFSGVRGTLGVLGWALGIAVTCALVSRLARFEPGYVYGLVAGFVVVRDGRRVRSRGLGAERDGATVLAGAVSVLMLSLAAYMVLDQTHDPALKDGAALWLRLLDAAMVATFVTGVQTIVFGLLPLSFMDGHTLFRWSRPVWAVVYGTGLAVFVYVLVLKHGDEGPRQHAGDLVRGLWVFLAFGVLSVLLWGFFRYRPAPDGAGDPAGSRRHGWAWFAAGAVLPSALMLAGGVWATAAFGGAGPAVASAPAPASPAPTSVPATASVTATPTAAPGTPSAAAVACEKGSRTVTDYRGADFKVWYCPTARAGEVYRTPGGGVATGFLEAGRNWFACRRQGTPDPSGGARTWLYTQGDDVYEQRGWGWFPASSLTSAGTDPSLPGLPACPADVPG
ncbi:FGLLP motif-containing membrane protein [Actinomadura scrupuli]|uniref:FGLLP motif-containing membrane protein n=1 Tax=Actinomadura scrupuli TaxID=559629 RepID=UPI003D95F3A2